MRVCCQNLLHIYKLQKKADDKRVKNRTYALGKMIWLNNKYIKTKRNKKLEKRFFGPFQIFYAIRKQVYKLKLPIKWKIYNLLHVSLLKQGITKKGQINKLNNELPDVEKEFQARNNKEYKVKAIINGAIYSQESNGQMLSLYYFVLWKS